MTGAWAAQVITRTSALEDLVPEWQLLFELCPSATPFQSPVWALNWWRVFAPGDLHVVCIRYAGRLVAIAPSYIDTSEDPVRVLPIGVGISDYLDVLIDPEYMRPACDVLAGYISECASHMRWEFCELPPDALALRLPTPPGTVEELAICSICPAISMAEGAPDLKQVLPAHRLKTLRAAWNRARRLGEVRFEHATPESASHWLDCLDALHRSRWESAGLPGVTADRRVYDFCQRAIPPLIEAGRAAIYALLLDGSCIAANLVLISERGMLHYMTGYDPRLHDIAPGAILLGHAIDRAREQCIQEFDFLRGEEPYKYLWGARPRPNTRRSFSRTVTPT